MDKGKIKVNHKISGLVDRFFTGKVISFIGAGVSRKAVHKDGRTGVADTRCMISSIAGKLLDLRQQGKEQKQWAKWRCSFLKCEKQHQNQHQGVCNDEECLLKELSNNSGGAKNITLLP